MIGTSEILLCENCGESHSYEFCCCSKWACVGSKLLSYQELPFHLRGMLTCSDFERDRVPNYIKYTENLEILELPKKILLEPLIIVS